MRLPLSPILHLNLLAVLLGLPLVIRAQISVTWTGAGSDTDWLTPANWTTATAPNATDAIATFGGSGPTVVTVGAGTTVDVAQVSFLTDAQAYTIGVTGRLTLNGTGVTKASVATQTFAVTGSTATDSPGYLYFTGGASSGNATITGTGSGIAGGGGAQIYFTGGSTAATATVTIGGALVSSTDGSQLHFQGNSTAGNATLTTTNGVGGGGQIYFWADTTAGNATITNQPGGAGVFRAAGQTYFFGGSLGNATIHTPGGAISGTYGGQTYFFNGGTAGSGTILTGGGLVAGAGGGSVYFFNGTGANGVFTTEGGAASGAYGGSVYFYGGTGGNGLFTLGGGAESGAYGASMEFNSAATAGNATLVAHGGSGGGGGSSISFAGDSLGGTAALKLDGNAQFTISAHNAPGVAIGSLEGEGTVDLGANSLTIGSRNTDTAFSGVISGVGGSLTKVGSGRFTLTGASTYDGGTIINAGRLVAAGGYGATSSLGGGGVTVNSGGVLAGNDFIAGAAVVNSGGRLTPGDPTGVLRFDGGLTLMGGSQVDVFFGAGSAYVQVAGGAFNASNGVVAFNFTTGAHVVSGTLYTLVDFAGATSYDFTDLSHFAIGTVSRGSPSDYTLQLNGTQLQVLTGSIIPEPSTYAALAGVAVLGLAVWRRRAE